MAAELTQAHQALTEPEAVINCKWPAEQVDIALLTLAILGDSDKAAEQLKAAGISVSARTLRMWRTKRFPRRYTLLAGRYSQEIEAQLVHGVRDIALNAQHGVMDAVDLERTRLKTGDVKDAAASARNLATVLGISADKLRLLTERPTEIREQRDGAAALRSADAMGFVIHEDDNTHDADIVVEPVSLLPPAA
jgi:hypothetical protein